MRAWLLMLGGMVVWVVHFGGVYAIASVFDVVSNADAPASLWLSGALTVVCLLANAALLLLIVRLRRRRGDDFVADWVLSLGALNAALSFVAVLWQGLPTIVGQ